eukprot:1161564-Pelagomonas_calceolata.AAC.7
MGERAPCELLPIITYSLPLANQAADPTTEATSSTLQGRGASPAPHRISKLDVLSPLNAMHIAPCWFGKLEWSTGGLRSPRNRPPPGPASSKGIHISMLRMKLFWGPEAAGLGTSRMKVCGIFAPKLCLL